MASRISEIVTSKLKLETSNKNLISNYNLQLTSLDIRIRALTLAEGLTQLEEPFNLTGWYCKAYKVLGEGMYTAAVKAARDGREPKKLFSHILKEQLLKKSNGAV